jgi:hypothetical protein
MSQAKKSLRYKNIGRAFAFPLGPLSHVTPVLAQVESFVVEVGSNNIN